MDEKTVRVLPEGVAKEVTLSDGRVASIFYGYGEHAEKAQEMATIGDPKGNQTFDKSKYNRALMHLLIEIDGEKVFPEDFPKMKMNDYLNLYGAFAEVNFT